MDLITFQLLHQNKPSSSEPCVLSTVSSSVAVSSVIGQVTPSDTSSISSPCSSLSVSAILSKPPSSLFSVESPVSFSEKQ